MQRDGALISLWQYKTPEYISQSDTINDEIFDALIVCGGITGITTALQLQKTGKNAFWQKHIQLVLILREGQQRI